MKISKFVSSLALVAISGSLLLSTTACSSIFNGSQQDVQIKSSENGAQITINGNNRGQTPAIIKLQRGQSHLIEIKKEGYETYRITTGKSLTGWFWGNLLCGGLVGMVIDLASGNAYDIEPDIVFAQMSKTTAMLGNYNSDDFSSVYLKDKTGKIVDSFVIEWE